MIASSDPFEAPTVDPRWLMNPLDLEVMIRAIQFNQRILDTPYIQELMPTYSQVPQDATVEEITAMVRSQLSTEFHYSGTCAMFPQELGGVVDSKPHCVPRDAESSCRGHEYLPADSCCAFCRLQCLLLLKRYACSLKIIRRVLH